MNQFEDRHDAGRRLAERLEAYRERSDTVVLGLPRGGVPVAHEVATQLNLPLDLFLVRKLGVPGREELAMGAIGSQGDPVLNHDVIQALHIPQADIEQVEARERREMQRREEAYLCGRKHVDVAGKTVILVDDGLATGASMKAAIQALKNANPKDVVVAVGTAPAETVEDLQTIDGVTEVVSALIPDVFFGVGGSYHDFSQTSDEEVIACLRDG